MNTSPNILPDEGFQGQIDADGRRPGHERSSRLRVAEQDQYHGIELKPVVMRRLRVIDGRVVPACRSPASSRSAVSTTVCLLGLVTSPSSATQAGEPASH